jgi:hypothetical protein
MRKRILGASALLLFILLAIVPFNTIVLSYQNKNIFVEPVFNQKEVSIRWTHSVEKEDWEEFFHIKDNTINLTSTRFKTFGAGVPDNAGEDTYIKDGWVYMTHIHQPIGDTLRFQTGKNTNHRISLNERTLVLDSQRSYQLSVGSFPMYELIYMIVND